MATPALQPSPKPPKGSQFRLSQRIESFGYWLAMTALATATVYLGYLALSGSSPPDAMDLGWGANTPCWIVECLPLSLVALYVGEAGYSRWQGVRSWKSILLGAGLLCFRGLTQWLPSFWTFQRN